MMAIYWILQIGVVIYALSVWISYRSERSDNKFRLQNEIDNRQIIRELTSEELELLEPFLTNKKAIRPYKLQPLIDNKVSVIEGPCIRHSLHSDGHESEYYHEIDNIEVFFPYNMNLFVKEYNVVEVVFTKKYAIVVNINTCDIAFAYNNYDPATPNGIKEGAEIPETFWDSPEFLDVNIEIIDDDVDYDESNNEDGENVEAICYETLSEREETPLEATCRNRYNYGVLTSIALVLATIFFIHSWVMQNNLNMVFPIGICLVVAVLFVLLRSKRLSKMQEVEVIKACIVDKNTGSSKISLGGSKELKYPKYWSNFLPEASKTPTEMDMAKNGPRLLRYGYNLSIDREVGEFGPPKIISRNLVLFFTGIILSAAVYFLSEPINNGILAYRYYNQQLQNWQINDLATLNKSDIERGDLVNITVKGTSCDVKSENKKQGDKCNHLFINNQPIGAEGNQLISAVDAINNIYSDKFIETVRDEEMILLEEYQKQLVEKYNRQEVGTYSMTRYKAKPFSKLINLGQIIIDTNKACNIFAVDCKSIKSKLIEIRSGIKYDNGSHWENVVEKAEKFPAFHKILESSLVDNLRSEVKFLKKNIINRLMSIVSNYQHNDSDVEITLTDGSYVVLTELNNIRNATSDEDLRLSIDYYYNILKNNVPEVNLVGLVDGVSYREDHSISALRLNVKNYYKLDTENLFSLTSPIIINIILFVIMISVAVINGVILLNKVRVNRRRIKQITKYYEDRMMMFNN
jgi:hypothetical protein